MAEDECESTTRLSRRGGCLQYGKTDPKTADLHSTYTLVTLLYFSSRSNSFANDNTLCAARRLTPDVTADRKTRTLPIA